MMKKINDVPTTLPIQIRWPPATFKKTGPDKLHMAVLMGKNRKIRSLVASGISVDARNREGQSGLFVAATLGKKSVVNTLLAFGANPNARVQPEGCTPLHGACYIGSLSILKSLLASGGDLRLSDTKRQTPEDWIEFQECIHKRKATRDFIERLRFCIMNKELDEMKVELEDKVTNFGLSLGHRMWNMMTGKCGDGRNNNIAQGLSQDNVVSTGFGKMYFGAGRKCVDVIGIPSVSEASDLKFDSNPKAPSWICGKYSTFIPMFWNDRKTAVTCKVLRRKSVEEAVPDILIAELAVLVRLQHPQILMILAVCQEENFDSLSLVFEKISVGSLYFFLHQQNLRMKASFATDIVIQISEALDYIHGCGFLHCAISSHAVMLMGENHAKLACFEYAIPEETTAAESYLSSRHPWLASDAHLSVIRHWIAPEVLIGSHPHSQASDVYSLCSVMWELVVGDVPWKDYDLGSLRLFLKENHGLQLHLRKDVIPPLWLSVLQVGLKRKWEERDLDFKEIRFMMTLAKERSSGGSATGTGDRKSTSKVSLRSAMNAGGGGVPHLGQGDRKSVTLERNCNNGRGIGVDVVDEDTNEFDHVDSRTSVCKSFKSEAFLQV